MEIKRLKIEVDPKLLARLQHLLQQNSDLNQRIERAPMMVATASRDEADAVSKIASIKEEMNQAQLAANQKQKLMDERESRIDDLKGKRNAASSNRDYQLLSDQIAAEQAANAALTNETLDLLEKIDRHESAMLVAEELAAKYQEKKRQVESQVDATLKSLHADIQAVTAELAEEEAKLPAQLKSEYRRLAAAVGENAIARLDENVCGNCYTQSSPLIVDQLRMNRVVFCPSCGSIMYD